MICLICRQAETIEDHTQILFARGEFRLLVNHVPARVCPGCGEAYVNEVTAQRLLELARQTSEAGIRDAQRDYGAL